MPIRDKSYWDRVKAHAKALSGDGCTDSPDFDYRRCCDEHDIAYRTGKDCDGNELTRFQADNELFRCMVARNKYLPGLNLVLPSLYWCAVRVFGRGPWKGDQAMGDKK